MENKKRNTIIAIAAAAVVIAGGGVFMAIRSGDEAVPANAPVSEASPSSAEESLAAETPSSADEPSEDSTAPAEADSSIVALDSETPDTDSNTPDADTPAYVETDSEIKAHLEQLEAEKENTPRGEDPGAAPPSANDYPAQDVPGKHRGPDGLYYDDEPGGPSSDGEGHYNGIKGSWLPGVVFTNDMGGDLSGYPQQHSRRQNVDPYTAYCVDFDPQFFEVLGIQVGKLELRGNNHTEFAANFARLVGDRFGLPLYNIGGTVDCDNLGDNVPTEEEWNAWINGRKAEDIPSSEIAAHYRWMNYEYDQGEELYFIFNALFRPDWG